MSSIFTRIIRGEIPCFKVAENDSCFAFLDVRPLAKGHVLVVPKKEVDYIFDLETQDYNELMHFASRIALAIKKEVPCIKVGMAVIGLEVPHAHVHLVPLNQISDLNFSNERVKISDDEMAATAKAIANHL
jgi:histidine triad (HIT) family protein